MKISFLLIIALGLSYFDVVAQKTGKQSCRVRKSNLWKKDELFNKPVKSVVIDALDAEVEIIEINKSRNALVRQHSKMDIEQQEKRPLLCCFALGLVKKPNSIITGSIDSKKSIEEPFSVNYDKKTKQLQIVVKTSKLHKLKVELNHNPNIEISATKNITFSTPFKAEVESEAKFVQVGSVLDIHLPSLRSSTYQDDTILLNRDRRKKASRVKLCSQGLVALLEKSK